MKNPLEFKKYKKIYINIDNKKISVPTTYSSNLRSLRESYQKLVEPMLRPGDKGYYLI